MRGVRAPSSPRHRRPARAGRGCGHGSRQRRSTGSPPSAAMPAGFRAGPGAPGRRPPRRRAGAPARRLRRAASAIRRRAAARPRARLGVTRRSPWCAGARPRSTSRDRQLVGRGRPVGSRARLRGTATRGSASRTRPASAALHRRAAAAPRERLPNAASNAARSARREQAPRAAPGAPRAIRESTAASARWAPISSPTPSRTPRSRIACGTPRAARHAALRHPASTSARRTRSMSSRTFSATPSVSLEVGVVAQRDERACPVDRLADAGELVQLLAAQPVRPRATRARRSPRGSRARARARSPPRAAGRGSRSSGRGSAA